MRSDDLARASGKRGQEKTMTTVAAVETALGREKDSHGISLRAYVNRIEKEYGSRRTVILWINGMGRPVQTVRQAIDKVRAVAE